MTQVIRGLVATFLLVACSTQLASADDVVVPSPATLQASIQHITDSVAAVQKFRDVRCPQQPQNLQGVCADAYNMLTARMEAARAELELILSATSLPEPNRSQIVKALQNPDRFNRNNAENGALGDQIYLLFPVPHQ